MPTSPSGPIDWHRNCQRASLMMTKRSVYGVTWARDQVQEGHTAMCTVADFKYSMCMYKNPKVGQNPPTPLG